MSVCDSRRLVRCDTGWRSQQISPWCPVPVTSDQTDTIKAHFQWMYRHHRHNSHDAAAVWPAWARADALLRWRRPSGCRSADPSAAADSSPRYDRSSDGRCGGNAEPRRRRTPCSPPRESTLETQIHCEVFSDLILITKSSATEINMSFLNSVSSVRSCEELSDAWNEENEREMLRCKSLSPSLILSSSGNGSSGCMLAAIRTALESSSTYTHTHTDQTGSDTTRWPSSGWGFQTDLEEALQHDVDDLVLLVDVVELH